MTMRNGRPRRNYAKLWWIIVKVCFFLLTISAKFLNGAKTCVWPVGSIRIRNDSDSLIRIRIGIVDPDPKRIRWSGYELSRKNVFSRPRLISRESSDPDHLHPNVIRSGSSESKSILIRKIWIQIDSPGKSHLIEMPMVIQRTKKPFLERIFAFRWEMLPHAECSCAKASLSAESSNWLERGEYDVKPVHGHANSMNSERKHFVTSNSTRDHRCHHYVCAHFLSSSFFCSKSPEIDKKKIIWKWLRLKMRWCVISIGMGVYLKSTFRVLPLPKVVWARWTICE